LFDDAKRLIRVDMSELSEKHAVARLIGAPPGYIGHDQGAPFIDQIRTQPYSVVLFDEIEKAHPDVYDICLQIFDEGKLTDGRGRSASFRDAVVIMTSNLGASDKERRRIGLMGDGAEPRDATAAYEQRLRDAVVERFRPELRSRIQKEVFFYPLSIDVLEKIVDRTLELVNERLQPYELSVQLTADCRRALASRGLNPALGARPLEQAVHELIEQPLTRMILDGTIARGQYLIARLDGEAITFEPGQLT
jgi:ATP-dependent Clp protease ATP-binding subunit ClpA